MKILHVINPLADWKEWERLGDTNMALRVTKNLPSEFENYLLCDTSRISAEEEIYIKERYNIQHLVDVSHCLGSRTYQMKVMKYVGEIAPEYDLVQFQQAQSASARWIYEVMKDGETPAVLTLHTPPEVRTIQHIYQQDFINMAGHPNMRLVAVSHSAKERFFTALGGGNLGSLDGLIAIRNGAETDKVDVDLKPIEDRTYDFITVGRLDPSKEILLNLKFARHASPEGRILYIGDTWKSTYKNKGDDEYAIEVRKFIEENDIEHIPAVPNEEVYKYMADSKVYVHLAEIETFSLTSCEAMLSGTPVIGIDKAGVGEITKWGVTGYAIPRVSREYWKKKFGRLAEAAELAKQLDPATIRQYAVDTYDVKHTIQGYIDLYKQLGGKN